LLEPLPNLAGIVLIEEVPDDGQRKLAIPGSDAKNDARWLFIDRNLFRREVV